MREGVGVHLPVLVDDVPGGLDLGRLRIVRAAGVGAPEDELRDALGMACGVGDRHRAGVHEPKEREALDFEAVDNGLDVADKRLHGVVGHVALGEADAARVVADELCPVGERLVPAADLGDLPLELDVAHAEPRHVDEGEAFAERPVGDVYVVARAWRIGYAAPWRTQW